MKVIARRVGYYNHVLRRCDDVFVLINDKDFTASWMTRVPDDAPERHTSAQGALDALHDQQGLGPTRRRVPEVDIDGSAATEFDPFRAS